MPLLTTCAIFGFKSLIKYAAEYLCDAVVPGSSDFVGGLIEDAVDTAGDRLQRNRNAQVPYWELGRALCSGCGTNITSGCVSHCITCEEFDLCAQCISYMMERSPQFHNPGHMWTIYMISKTTRGYANLDNKPSLGAKRSPSIGRCQYHCTGYYMQHQERTAMGLTVTFSGRNASEISGSGHDAIGEFAIQGQRFGDQVQFIKQYRRHIVEYDGAFVDSSMLVGNWTVPGYDSGPFVLMLEPIDHQAQAVERATWSGHYVQFGTRHRTAVSLEIYSSGRIGGKGRDSVGFFEIQGRFLNNTTGHFIFTKKYSSHAISYEGVRQGSVMTGTYQSPATGRDQFRLQLQ